MKKSILILGTVLSQATFACETGTQLIEFTLISTLLLIIFCAIAIPLSGMLINNIITKKEIGILATIVFIGAIISLGIIYSGIFLGSEVIGILSAALTTSLPAAFYLFKAVKRSYTHSVHD